MGFHTAHYVIHWSDLNTCLSSRQSRRNQRTRRGFDQSFSAMNVCEDLLAVTQRNPRTKTSSEPIPFDIIVEIFLRLPARSVARYRCVSKQWASIPVLPYFSELFFTRSSARPKLLFAWNIDGQVLFFSSPHPRILGEDSLSPLAADYQMKIPYDFSFERFTPIRGFAFLRDRRIIKGIKHLVPVVCNPGTGQYLTLPKVKSRRRVGVRSFFGYDPVENQYKVLSMTWVIYGSQWRASEEHQVLTFGPGREPSWKKIECSIPHSLLFEYDHICIDGVVYYRGFNTSSMAFLIICFDVRSEKFSFVRDTDPYTQIYRCAPLINHNGKLGSFSSQDYRLSVDGSCASITLRVLEDAEKHEWSKRTYELPDIWEDVVGATRLSFVGVTRTNEIVFAPRSQCVPFYVFYYNTERDTVTRVEIQGMEACQGCLYTFMDHVEDVSLMDLF